jgi:4-amino-4-deoxy-L-arabinose transferase-like glycosyltransferase
VNSPEGSSRLRLPLIAGLALLAAAAASWGLHADRVHGLTVRYYGNPSFDGDPVRVALEREPFVPLGSPLPFSATWTGYFYAPRPGAYSFEVASDDDSQLDVDGQAVVSNPGVHEPRLARGRVALTVGLHAFTLRYVQRGGGAYLRVGYHYDNGPMGAADPSNRPIGRPLPWSQLFPESFAPSPAAYAAAEGAYQRQRVLAAMALGAFIGALLLAWIEWRRRRGFGPASPVDLTASLGIFGVGWITRLIGLDAQGRTWDERDYFLAALHYMRNLLLGDGAPLAFRYNLEHPPVAKWIYAVFTALLAKNDDDHSPGKLAASLMGAATCALIYLIIKELYDRRTGVLAGLLCALLPPFIAHGKTLGLEAPMTLFYVAALYGIVRWFKDDTRLEPLVWAGLCTSLAIFSRMTAVWLLPTLLVPYLHAVITGANRGRRARAILPYLGGLAAGVGVAYALWPWIWSHPYDQLMQTYGHWSGWKTREWYLGKFREPPFSYYEIAFLLSAPIGFLIPTLAWAVSSVWRRKADAALPPRAPASSDLILAAFLLFPFLQSIPDLRQDAVRYVIQAFPALAATSAVGFFRLWSLAERRLPTLRRSWAPSAAGGLLVAYAAGVCFWIHPYYLDYFNEILDGPAGMQRGKVCELSWWGEGITNLVDWVNANAPPNARVAEHLVPDFDVPSLRPDLNRVDEHTEADYIVLNDFSFAFAESATAADLSYFRAGPSSNWEVVYRATAGNQDIGWVYRRVGGR